MPRLSVDTLCLSQPETRAFRSAARRAASSRSALCNASTRSWHERVGQAPGQHLRLAQSITATRYRKPRCRGM